MSRGKTSSQTQHPAHASMTEVDARAEHHWARTSDDADSVLTAVLDGRGRDAGSFPHRLVHPHSSHSGVCAIVHDLLGSLSARDDHNAVDAAGDRSQVGKTANAVEGLHVRIQREDLVPGLLQPAIDEITGRVVAVIA